MVEPLYDEFGVPLTQSGISERIWAFYKADPQRFKDEVRSYFALGMPGWSVVKANYTARIIWLKDERRRQTSAQ